MGVLRMVIISFSVMTLDFVGFSVRRFIIMRCDAMKGNVVNFTVIKFGSRWFGVERFIVRRLHHWSFNVMRWGSWRFILAHFRLLLVATTSTFNG